MVRKRIEHNHQRGLNRVEKFKGEMDVIATKVNIEFDNLGLVLKGGKKVLSGVTGTIRSGRVTAIMGPSGAGKSTFMTVLAGKAYYGKQEGHVLFNGDANRSHFLRLMGFVPQEDVMLRELNVKEILQNSAVIKNGTTKVNDIVERVIHELRLSAIQYSVIGDENVRGISGGQRKRVNIGMELVGNPSVLFLDEPTSGLDSSSSKEVCGLLKALAGKGMTVVSVIHQPRADIFRMFDDLVLLGTGGVPCYIGPSSYVIPYFASLGYICPQMENPADYFMDVISGVIPNDKGEFINVPASWRERKHEVEEIAAAEKQQQQDAERSHRVSVSSATSTSDSLQEQVPGLRSKVQPTDGYMLLEDEESQSRAKPNLILVILVQFAMFLKRGLAQQYKQPATISFDFLLVLVIALSMGLIFSNLSYIDAPSPTQFADAINATNTFEGLFSCKDSQLLMLTLSNAMLIPLADEIYPATLMMTLGISLAASVAALRTFLPEKAVYFRESAAGGYTIAYFLAKATSTLPNLAILPLLYAAIIKAFASFEMPFERYYAVFVLSWFTATGIGFLVSVVVPAGAAAIATVMITFSMSIVSGTFPPLVFWNSMGAPLKWIPNVSFLRWGIEILYTSEITARKARTDHFEVMGLSATPFPANLLWMWVIGMFFFILALVLMISLDRKRKR
jgi:ABC-type multidrug transport system ATPase subunit